MSEPDRRTRIAEAALDIVADSGVRALTHRAVDGRAGLPAGSTSFYVRTKQALLEAAVTWLAERARQDFEESGSGRAVAGPADVTTAAEQIAVLLDRMLGLRRRDTVARYALSFEVAGDESLRRLLATSAFSLPLAVELMRVLGAADPEWAGAGLVSLTEGLVFDRVVGNASLVAPPAGSAGGIEEIAAVVEAFLRGVVAT